MFVFKFKPLVGHRQLIDLTHHSFINVIELFSYYYRLNALLLNLDYVTSKIVISIIEEGLTHV